MGNKLTKEKTEKIMRQYRSDNRVEKDAATMAMIEGLSDFIGNMAHGLFPDYARKPEINAELMQTGRIAIIEHLPEYDETLTLPTTFFAYHIRSALCKYVNAEYNNNSLYYAQKGRQVKRAINDFKQKGESFSLEDLARATDLTLPTIENTLEQLDMNVSASLDESINVKSDYYTPESVYEKKEITEIILESLEILDDEERDVIEALYVHQETPSFASAAASLGMTVEKVARLNHHAIVKLRRCTKLRALVGDRDYGRHILNRMELRIVPIASIENQLDELNGMDNEILGLDDTAYVNGHKMEYLSIE